MRQEKFGVLLVNLGTPEAPTSSAVKRYLAEFLSDKRVVDVSRLIWWPVLNGIILPIRSPGWLNCINPSGWMKARR